MVSERQHDLWFWTFLCVFLWLYIFFVSMGFGALPEARDLESCGHAQIGGKRRENQGLVNTRGVFRKKKANSGRGGTPPRRFKVQSDQVLFY